MLRKVVKVQIDTWEYIMKGNGDEAVQAIVKQRSGMKLDPEALKGQLEQNLALFNTEATKGRRIGWQAREDWAAALKSMKEAGAISGNLKPEDHFTNAFIPDR
jgi:NitT/TauT family transport system substrate-binding protein